MSFVKAFRCDRRTLLVIAKVTVDGPAEAGHYRRLAK
jgi:hypothetical protein